MSGAPFIGVVSDTHGYYDPVLDELFAGAARIVHAGDVGQWSIIERLRQLAPVTAVTGNVDWPDYTIDLPDVATAEVLGLRVLVGHIGKRLIAAHPDPGAEGFDLVVSGHSHRAAIEWRGATLFLNPGSAGKRRFNDPRTAALVAVVDGRPEPTIVTLD